MKKIEIYRKQIDEIDAKLLKLLAQRFTVAKKIAKSKIASGISFQDKKRENEILERISKRACTAGVNKKCVRTLWGIIFKESQRMQRMNSKC